MSGLWSGRLCCVVIHHITIVYQVPRSARWVAVLKFINEKTGIQTWSYACGDPTGNRAGRPRRVLHG